MHLTLSTNWPVRQLDMGLILYKVATSRTSINNYTLKPHGISIARMGMSYNYTQCGFNVSEFVQLLSRTPPIGSPQNLHQTEIKPAMFSAARDVNCSFSLAAFYIAPSRMMFDIQNNASCRPLARCLTVRWFPHCAGICGNPNSSTGTPSWKDNLVTSVGLAICVQI